MWSQLPQFGDTPVAHDFREVCAALHWACALSVQIAGKVGIADQLEICDGVTVLAMTAVGGSIHKPGVYAGAVGMEEVTSFRRSAVRFRQLDEMAKEIRALKKEPR